MSRLYGDLVQQIIHKQLPVGQLARRERVTPKTFKSAQRKRLAVAAEGVNIGDYITVYERADGTLGLIEEYDGDENTEHLLDKLYKFACRLKEVFGPEFDSLIPNPALGARVRRAEAAGQQSLF